MCVACRSRGERLHRPEGPLGHNASPSFLPVEPLSCAAGAAGRGRRGVSARAAHRRLCRRPRAADLRQPGGAQRRLVIVHSAVLTRGERAHEQDGGCTGVMTSRAPRHHPAATPRRRLTAAALSCALPVVRSIDAACRNAYGHATRAPLPATLSAFHVALESRTTPRRVSALQCSVCRRIQRHGMIGRILGFTRVQEVQVSCCDACSHWLHCRLGR